MDVDILDIRKWQIPIYSVDMDRDHFTPDKIHELIRILRKYDGYILSVPEHNGGPTVFFKNITDWLTRRSQKILNNKPVLLTSTSTGRGGAKKSRAYYEDNLHRIGGKVVATFSLPSFNYSLVDGSMVDEHNVLLKESIVRFFDSFQ